VRNRRVYVGVWESSLSSGVFSGMPFHRSAIPGLHARRTVCAEVSRRDQNCQHPRE